VAASLLAATYAVRPIVRRFVEAMFHGRLPCAWLNTLLEHHEAGALDHYYGRAERGFRSLSGGKAARIAVYRTTWSKDPDRRRERPLRRELLAEVPL